VQPYVIRQGDTLAKLAYKFGFDALAVWNDDANAELRAARPDPDILLATDILYIPDQASAPDGFDLKIGQTNTFTSTVPTFPVQIRFADGPMANRSFTIQELPDLTGLATGGDGSVSIDVPVTMDSFTIEFDGIDEPFVFNVGHLDPVDTFTGVFQRLQNLGYIDIDVPQKAATVELVRVGLRRFKTAQGPDSSSPPSAPDSQSQPPDSTSTGDDGPSDSSGLSDDGTPDRQTTDLLRSVYGF
jgi:hypothetical protein